MSDSMPATWATAKVEDVLQDGSPVVYGILQPGPDTADGVPYIRPSEIDDDVIQVSDLRRTTPAIAAKYKRSAIRPSDVILSIVGTIGKVAIVPEGLDGANITQSSCRLRFDSSILLPHFAAFALRSPLLRRQFDLLRLGTAVPRLNIAHVRELTLPVAPLPEQQRIVAKIEELFSDLDAGVAALERVRAKLKRYRASVLNAAVTGKLTEAWRQQNPTSEPADKLLSRILDERRKAWEAEQLRKFAEAVKTPQGWQARFATIINTPTSTVDADGWVTCRLDALCEIGTGTTPSRGNASYYNGTIPWVTSGAVNDPFVTKSDEHVTETALAETRLRVYPKHTLIVALYGEGKTRGKVSELLIPATVNQALGTLTMHPGGDECRRYLKISLLASYLSLRHQAAGGVQPNLNLALLSATTVRLPPLAEQAEIVAEVERRLSVVAAVEAEVEHGLKRAARLRQAILKRAFEGKLVPQDPADEPASVLLARVGDDSGASIEIRSTPRSRGRKRKDVHL